MKKALPTTPPLPRRFSLVAQTVDSLQKGIESGHWEDHLPGERELCEALQVSRRTLRSALDELQRQGWLEVSSRQRRRIKSRRTPKKAAVGKKVIGILAPGSFLALPSPVTFIMDVLRSRLTAAGYNVQFHIQPTCYTGHPARALSKFIAEHPATVWLILSAQEPMQRWFDGQRIPCLILGSSAPGISLPSVDMDFHAACHHAGAMLWRRGHRRIALVLPKTVYGGDIASEEGLREASKDAPGGSIRVLRHDTTASSLCSLLDEALRSPQPPTAFLIARASHVLTAIMHFLRRGKRIPQDIAVLSRDNDPVLEAVSPVVARYGIQPAQLANRIAHAVRQLADSGVLSTPQVRLMPSFIEGETC